MRECVAHRGRGHCSLRQVAEVRARGSHQHHAPAQPPGASGAKGSPSNSQTRAGVPGILLWETPVGGGKGEPEVGLHWAVTLTPSVAWGWPIHPHTWACLAGVPSPMSAAAPHRSHHGSHGPPVAGERPAGGSHRTRLSQLVGPAGNGRPAAWPPSRPIQTPLLSEATGGNSRAAASWLSARLTNQGLARDQPQMPRGRPGALLPWSLWPRGGAGPTSHHCAPTPTSQGPVSTRMHSPREAACRKEGRGTAWCGPGVRPVLPGAGQAAE